MNIYEEFSEAFTIFAKYDTDGYICAEHDEIFAGPNPEIVSEEDKKKLEELGWRPNDVDTFSKFV